MWLMFFLAVTAAVMVILLISPVTVEIKYTYCKVYAPGEGAAQELVPDRGVRVALLWGLISLRLKLTYAELVNRAGLPVLKIRARLDKQPGAKLAEEKAGLTPRRVLDYCRLAAAMYRFFTPAHRYLLARTVLRHFRWHTGLGLPEAGQTGMAVGLLWVVKSNATSFLYRLVDRRAPRPELAVQPVFNRQLLHISFDCIFTMRSGHIIYTTILAGWYYLKERFTSKGRRV